MNNSAVVFDFNGTLFWDTAYQELSWILYLQQYNIELSKEEMNLHVHGRNAMDTFVYLFKRELSKEQVFEYTEEKEVIYRRLCEENPMELAPGAVELLMYLQAAGIPIAIATAAGKSNVDFFIEKFDLLKFFKREHIIYNDGNIQGKPHPDLFLKAIAALGAQPKNTTIFEDSMAGIEAAKRSQAKNVVLVNSSNPPQDVDITTIHDFNDFDRTLL